MNVSLSSRERPEEAASAFVAGSAVPVAIGVRERLWRQMTRECEAMVTYALSTGLTVPAESLELLETAFMLEQTPAGATPDRRAGATTQTGAIRSPLALLATVHTTLALLIAPATPEAVSLMSADRERHPVLSRFGPLPLIRQMLGLALISLICLLAVSLSAAVNTANMTRSLLELSGAPLMMVELFLVSAASLGSCFANLQRLNTVISKGTYDPRVQSTYWTRWVMGVISGVVLSQIIYDFFLHSDTGTSAPAIAAIAQPILALFGGYSVDFVHGILRRLVNTFSNFFGLGGDALADGQSLAVISDAARRGALSASLPPQLGAAVLAAGGAAVVDATNQGKPPGTGGGPTSRLQGSETAENEARVRATS